MGEPVLIIVCATCGVTVGSREVHRGWHVMRADRMVQAMDGYVAACPQHPQEFTSMREASRFIFPCGTIVELI